MSLGFYYSPSNITGATGASGPSPVGPLPSGAVSLEAITLATPGGTPSSLNYYENYDVIGEWDNGSQPSESVATTISFTRLGGMCTLKIPKFFINIVTSCTILIFSSNTFFTRLIPTGGGISIPVAITKGGAVVAQLGMFQFNVTGLVFTADPSGVATWGALSGNGGISKDIQLTYLI